VVDSSIWGSDLVTFQVKAGPAAVLAEVHAGFTWPMAKLGLDLGLIHCPGGLHQWNNYKKGKKNDQSKKLIERKKIKRTI
jgi:hypothetical protein